MKTAIILTALGLACGVVAHDVWFSLRRPAAPNDLDDQLVWMKQSLQLDQEQFARIKAVHEELSPRLLWLAAQVERMKAQSAAFEDRRRDSGMIDFLEYARFIQERRAVDRECLESTKRLVSSAADVMTPEQRNRYFSILAPALHDKPAAGSPQ